MKKIVIAAAVVLAVTIVNIMLISSVARGLIAIHSQIPPQRPHSQQI